MLVLMDVRFFSLKLALCLNSNRQSAVCCSDGLFNHDKSNAKT